MSGSRELVDMEVLRPSPGPLHPHLGGRESHRFGLFPGGSYSLTTTCAKPFFSSSEELRFFKTHVGRSVCEGGRRQFLASGTVTERPVQSQMEGTCLHPHPAREGTEAHATG